MVYMELPGFSDRSYPGTSFDIPCDNPLCPFTEFPLLPSLSGVLSHFFLHVVLSPLADSNASFLPVPSSLFLLQMSCLEFLETQSICLHSITLLISSFIKKFFSVHLLFLAFCRSLPSPVWENKSLSGHILTHLMSTFTVNCGFCLPDGLALN